MRRVCIVADKLAPRIAVMPAVVVVDRFFSKSLGAGLIPLQSWADEEELSTACRRFGFRLVKEEIHEQ